MDNGQPDFKRPRTVGPTPGPSSSWTPSQDHARSLPLPQPNTPSTPQYPQHGLHYPRPPESQPYPLDAHRRHSAHTDHRPFEQDPRRPNSIPSTHVFHQPTTQPQLPPYGGQQDVTMKREPGEDVQYRPGSTGSAPDHNISPVHADARYQQQQQLPPFDLAQHSRSQPYQPGPSYVPQSPMPGNEPYGHPGYGPPSLPPPRHDYTAYATPIATTQKRKAQRAAQACDSCRNLKAKCDEGRPLCNTCKERGFQCVYRDPPPKQQDKSSAEIVEAVNLMNSNNMAYQERTESKLDRVAADQITILERLSRLENTFPPNLQPMSNQGNDSNNTRDFQVPAPRPAPAHPAGRRPGPSPLTGPATEHSPSLNESPFPSNTSQQQASDVAVEMTEPVEEEEDGPTVNPGQSFIPVNHTTGAARLLLNPSIRELAVGIMKSDKIKNVNYPMLQEERRGLLRLFGRGEGTDRISGYDKEPLTDVTEGNTPTPSDASSDAGSPDEEWGQLGSLTPPPSIIQQGNINHEGMPDFNANVVNRLVESYLKHINPMHPILVPSHITDLVKHFLKSIPRTTTDASMAKPRAISQLTGHAPTQSGLGAGFVGGQGNKGPDSPSNKRKRSNGTEEVSEPAISLDFKPGQPFRTIGTAIVLLVMALGEICQQKGKIQEYTRIFDSENTWGSPAVRNGYPSPSGLHSSPSMSTVSGLPSPVDGERNQPRSRRSSIDGQFPPRSTSVVRPKNLDVVPGLKYFAFATDILGNQAGGNSLQHVHANILASLYHGQLARPVESHAYLHQACRSLQVILRPKLDRFKRLQGGICPARDNRLIMAFWTCLQLESDIIAELPVPHSGILTYEEDMPGLNLDALEKIDGFDSYTITSYAAQLHMRKHLNQLHNMFYKPANDSDYPSVLGGRRPPPFKTIDASLENLEAIKTSLPTLIWEDDDDHLAPDILRARIRAKYYGAKVITYRPFLEKVLEHSSTQRAKQRAARGSAQESPQLMKRQEEFIWDQYKKEVQGVPTINSDATSIDDVDDERIKDYAKKGIKALVRSTTAFHGLGDPAKQRLIVTNIWGTAHAQWGNLITLLAAYNDPILRPIMDMTKQELRELYEKTMGFLRLVAQPSSALYIDYKILEYVAKEVDLIPKQASSSFSSTSGDVPTTGH